MKKILLILVVIFLFTSQAFSTTALYNVESGEVLIISLDDAPFTDDIINPNFAVIGNATYPDGEQATDSNFDLRVLGISKILDGTVIRNATQAEIDNFTVVAVDQRNQAIADKALQRFLKDSKFRMIISALIKGIIKEDNENRSWIRDFKDAVAASTSLANFQSRVAALDTPADREFQEAKDYIISQVSKDD